MVWLFILLTVVTYSFVMKHVLSHIQKPVKVVNKQNHVKNENMVTVVSVQPVRS